MTAEEKEYLLGLLKNPAESGFDLNRDCLLYTSAPANWSSRALRRRSMPPANGSKPREHAAHSGFPSAVRSTRR